jgi:hypothetical protein
MLTRSSSAAATSAAATATAERQNSNNNNYFRRSTHASASNSANRSSNHQDYTSTRRLDPQTPVTESSSYISPGQRSRRSNEAILQEIYLRVEEQDNDDAASCSQDAAATLPELQNMVITTTTAAAAAATLHSNKNANINTMSYDNSCDLSVMTDDFYRATITHQQSRSNPFGESELFNIADDLSAVSLNFFEEEEPKRQPELNVLFTFRRRDVRYDSGDVGEGTCTIFETTLNARTCGPDEESMEDLVKRLQQKGRASGVLKFNRGLIQKIRDGEKEVVFVLVQVKGSKFSKEEFGRMMASEVVGLTHERPIVVEIQTEDAVEGETLDVF